MPEERDIKYSLELDVKQWERSVDRAIGGLRDFEQSLDRAMGRVDQFEAQLNSALKGLKDGDIDIKVDASLGAIDPGIERLTSQDNVDIIVDASAGVIDPNIEDIYSQDSVDIVVDASEGSVASSIDELLGDPTSTITADVNEGTFDSDVKDVIDNSTTTITVNVEEGTFPETLTQLLGVDAAVNLAVNITGIAGGAAGGALGVAGFFVDPLIEADTAVQRFEARTGQSIEGMADMIKNVWANGWGDSQAQVGDVMTKLVSDLDVPAEQLEHLTALVLDTADVMEADWTEVMSSAAAMVDSGFAPSLERAMDTMVVGQQEGLNRAGDLLDTFREYSTTFTDMGFTMDDALSVMNAGLEAGIDNTDRIADSIREAGIRATTDFEAKEDFFEQAGLVDEAKAFAAGELTGKQYMDALFKALSQTEDKSVRDLIQDELLGTISEDFGADALAALGNIEEKIQSIGGEAQTASDTINNTIGVSWTTIKNTFQSEVADYFNNQLDFTGFMQRLKNSVSGFFSDLKSGEGFGESLSINLSSALDNTEFGEIIATMVDAILSAAEAIVGGTLSLIEGINKLPIGDIDPTGTEGMLSDIRSFRFNLSLGDVEEMDRSEFADFFADAMEKDIAGVTPRIVEGFETALANEMSGVEAGTLLGNIKFAQSQVSDELKPLFEPLAQDAAQQTWDAFNEAFASNDLSEALDIGTMLVGAGEMDASGLELLKSTIRLNLGDLLSEPFSASDLEQLPNIWEDYMSIASPDEVPESTLGQIGMELDELFRTAISKGDFDLMETIIGTGEEIGLDTSFWEENLRTTELEEQAQSISDSMATAGEEGSESLGLMGAASDDLDVDFRTATDNMTMNFSKMTSQIQTDTALIETAFNLIGTTWNLLPEGLRGALVGGFPTPALPGGGGGGGSSTTINQTNTFNNNTGAASAGSGQAVANAINQPA